jgi:Zn-dependent protease with chaperone function
MASDAIDQWLRTFPLDAWIKDHVAAVIENLPENVRIDLMGDPDFIVFSTGGKPGRSIVLKRTMKRRPIPFVRWVIAHELAHAFLRHEGRWSDEDPEHAADSLAAEWGFPKPKMF